MFQVKNMVTLQEVGPSGGRGTECREDEGGVDRGHCLRAFRKTVRDLFLSHCLGSWREFEKGAVVSGRAEGIVGCSDLHRSLFKHSRSHRSATSTRNRQRVLPSTQHGAESMASQLPPVFLCVE